MLDVLNDLLEVLMRLPAAYEREPRFVGCVLLALALALLGTCGFLGWVFLGG